MPCRGLQPHPNVVAQPGSSSAVFPSSPPFMLSTPCAAEPDGRLDGSAALLSGEAVSLTMWSLLYCGPDPQLGQIISAPQVSRKQCEITAADSSCWGSGRYQTKRSMKTLTCGGVCQKFRWITVDPKANPGCDFTAHHCTVVPAL